jgi:hypothetical protein
MIGPGFATAAGAVDVAKLLKIAAAILLLVVVLALSYCQGRKDGAASVKLADTEARNDQLQTEAAAAEEAAEQRIEDALTQEKADEEYKDAIDAAPGGVNSPAAVARACQRLRRAGYLNTELPIECRSGIGYGAEAAPRP